MADRRNKRDSSFITEEVVRAYTELGSVRLLKQELEVRGVTTRAWTSASARRVGGKPFSRGGLYLILQNRIYLIGPILLDEHRLRGRRPEQLNRTADEEQKAQQYCPGSCPNPIVTRLPS